MKTRAAVLQRTDATHPYAESRPLVVEELTLAVPGPGEVLVRVGAAGVCHSDLSVVDGVRPRPVPMVLGHEAAGVVEEVGAGVAHVAAGDHVVFAFVPSCGDCVPCLSGRPALCERGAVTNTAGTLLAGTRPFTRADGSPVNQHLGVSAFAERTVAAAASVVKVPSDLPLDQAALFGCALLTGVGAVLNTAKVAPGSTALIVGLGGVGLASVMGARLAGCTQVIAVDTDKGKFDLAEQVGATAVITGDAYAVERVREITGGEWTTPSKLRVTRVPSPRHTPRRDGEGTTVGIGLPHPTARFELPALSLVAEERRLVGSYMGSAVPRRDIPRYVELFREGRLPVDKLAGGTWRLDQVNEAMDALAGGAVARQLLLPEPR